MKYVSGEFLCDFLSNLTTYYNNHRSTATAEKTFSYTPTTAIKKSCLTLGEMVAIRHFVWNTLMSLGKTGGKTRQLYIDSSTALGILDGTGSMTTAEYKLFLHDTIKEIVTTLKINCGTGGIVNVNSSAPISNSTRNLIKNLTYTLSPSPSLGWMGGSWSDTGESGNRSILLTTPTELSYTFKPGANHFYYSDTTNVAGGAWTSAGNLVKSNYGGSTWETDSVDMSGNYMGETRGTIPAGKWLTVLNSDPIYIYRSPNAALPSGSDNDYYIQGFKSITKAIINNLASSVGLIPYYAFYRCLNLQEIEIGTGNTASGVLAVNACGYSNPITTFGTRAFRYCTALTKVTIGAACLNGNSAIIWGSYLFEDCRNLALIDIGCTVPPVYTGSGAAYWFPSASPTIIVPAASLNAYRTAANWSGYKHKILGRYTYKPNTSSTGKYYTFKSNYNTTISIGITPTSGSAANTTIRTMTLLAGIAARYTGGSNGVITSSDVIHSDYPLTITEISLTSYNISRAYSSTYTNWLTYLTINGNAWGTDTSKSFYEGEQVTISISRPNYITSIYYLLSGGLASLADESVTFTVTGNTTVYLNTMTRIKRNLSITAEHANITATQDGSTLTLTKSGNTYTASVNQGATIVLSYTNHTGYTFSSYTGDATSNSFTIEAKDYNISVNSTINSYNVKTNSSDTSKGNAYIGDSGSVTSQSFNYNTAISIRAVGNTGYTFDKWQDNNTENPRPITVTADALYTASFKPIKYTITALSENTSKGTVSGGGDYDYGTKVTVTATPLSGYTFNRFVNTNPNETSTDNPYKFTVVGASTVTAYFDLIVTYTISVQSSDANMGKVWINTSNTSINQTSITVTSGTTYFLGLKVNQGYQFISWSNGSTNSNPSYTATASTSYIATFDYILYLVAAYLLMQACGSGINDYKTAVSLLENAGVTLDDEGSVIDYLLSKYSIDGSVLEGLASILGMDPGELAKFLGNPDEIEVKEFISNLILAIIDKKITI